MTFDMQAIASSLETEICEVHQMNPKAVVMNGDIQISACCDAFNEELQGKLEARIAKQLEASLEEMLKGLNPE